MQPKREGDKVWLDGVEGFSSGVWASSMHGSMARILEVIGSPLTYDDLVCYGGFAFRTSIHAKLCPSAAHPLRGYKCIDGSVRALPWKIRFFESFPWTKRATDRDTFESEVRAAIVDSIDRGVPAHYAAQEDGLIIGYGSGGSRWWCVHPYHEDGSEPFWHDEASGFAGPSWPWAVSVWIEPKDTAEIVDTQELTIGALNQAVRMWKTEKRGSYFIGAAAYGHWLEWLRGVEPKAVEVSKRGMQGNGWCFEVLIQSRRIASSWLNKIADDAGAARDPLRSAAGSFATLVDVCMADLDSPWDLACAPERVEEWTREKRRAQIARIESAQGLDGTAVELIEEALALLG